jgi:DNA topoisomerase-3
VKGQENVSDEEYKIYDLVSRHFLACVSKNAIGNETVVKVAVAEEEFTTKGYYLFI